MTETRTAPLDAEPRRLPNGRLLVPLDAFDDGVLCHDTDDHADRIGLSWPGGGLTGRARQMWVEVEPEPAPEPPVADSELERLRVEAADLQGACRFRGTDVERLLDHIDWLRP